MRYTEAPARRAELLRRLSTAGYVSSARLSAEFGVSEMTIRRDLRQLHLDGRAQRVPGGASLPLGGPPGLPFDQRDQWEGSHKRDIAAACAEYIAHNSTVALDAGTTVAQLVGFLAPGVTVVSHSVPVIAACSERDDLRLLGLGGTYRADTRSFTGQAARAGLAALSIETAVISATAVNRSGLLCANDLDAELKQAMCQAAERTILLVDHTKIGARAPIRFGNLQLADIIITDEQATAAQLRALRRAATVVVVVAPSSHSGAAISLA